MKFINIGFSNLVSAERIITDSDHVILSALPPETIAARIDGSAQNAEFPDENSEGQL